MVSKKRLVVYASPECCRQPNLRLYKGYFNVAWFIRAYQALLFHDYEVVTTDETKTAVLDADPQLDEDLSRMWNLDEPFFENWRVPHELDEDSLQSVGRGFDAQVTLAAMVARGEVDRLLMFQDPDDVQSHLPEAHALIRNCTLANVGLNINAGATVWAEAQWARPENSGMLDEEALKSFGPWRSNNEMTAAFRELLNPGEQTIAFIAHDAEKPRMSRLVYHYSDRFAKRGFVLTGTAGTCKDANAYLTEWGSPDPELRLKPAGAADGAGHGPTGGDVVIASDILQEWRCDPNAMGSLPSDEIERKAHKTKQPVRKRGLSHTVVFFIDHKHAQPHQADIQVLLRTCLHPSHGVQILLNERTAREWAENLSSVGQGSAK